MLADFQSYGKSLYRSDSLVGLKAVRIWPAQTLDRWVVFQELNPSIPHQSPARNQHVRRNVPRLGGQVARF